MSQKLANAIELGKILGITERQVRRLERQGILWKESGNLYSVQASKTAYGAYRKGVEAREPGEITAERIRLLKIQVARKEFDLQVLQKQFLFRQNVIRGLSGILIATKNNILAVPSKAASRLTDISSAIEIKEILQKYLTEALHELANTSIEKILSLVPEEAPVKKKAIKKPKGKAKRRNDSMLCHRPGPD